MTVGIDFSGKTALVTGGSRGIGAASARAVAAAGANVIINHRKSGEAAEAVAEGIRSSGGEAAVFQFDVSDREAVRSAIEEIGERFGGVDLLVNNAGARFDNLTHRMDPAEWRLSLATNLEGTFNVTQGCLAGMMSRRFGRIVLVSSVAGQIGSLGQSNYAAAKAGAVAFTKSVAIEYAGRNIRANAVIPGIIETEMTADLKGDLREDFIKRIPLKRFGTPDEVASVVLFLLSDLSAYITGATLSVNGGGLMI